jgi:hypothetical protein
VTAARALLGLAAVLPLAAAIGCGYAGIAVVTAVAGDDGGGGGGVVVVVNDDTQAAILDVPRVEGAIQPVRIRVTDPQGDAPVFRLEARVGGEAAPFLAATLAAVRDAGGVVIRVGPVVETGPLAGAPGGIEYVLDWSWRDQLGDAPTAGVTLRLSIVGTDGGPGRAAFTAPPRTIGNDRPVVSGIAVAGASGTVVVSLRVRDSTGDRCDLRAAAIVEGGAARTITAVDEGALSGITTTALDREVRFAWRTRDEPFLGDDARANVVVEVAAVESETGVAGDPAQSIAFLLVNDLPPEARWVSAPARAASGPVRLELVLADPEGDPASVTARWRILGGSLVSGASEGAVSLASGPGAVASLAGLAASPGGTRHVLLWDAAADLGTGTARVVEVAVSPLGAGASGDTTPPVEVGNDAPRARFLGRVPPASGGDIALAFSLEDGSRDPSFVTLEVSAAGGAFGPATVSGSAAGLLPGPTGAPLSYAVTWRSAVDLPSASGTPVTLRLRASDGLPFGVGPFATTTTTITNATLPPPSIAAVVPDAGRPEGGTSVVVLGSGFSAGGVVARIGGAPLGLLAVIDDGALRGTTAPHAAGPVDVEVRTLGGAVTRTGGFRYDPAAVVSPVVAPALTAVTPAAGPLAGGISLRLSGSGFLAAAVTVTVDGTSASDVAVLSDTTLTSTLPPRAAPGTVAVGIETPGGSASLAGAFTYLAPPSISSVSPGRGPTAGGTSLAIAGAGFAAGETAATVGGLPLGAPVSVTPGAVTGLAPALASGLYDVVIRAPGGEARAAGAYRAVRPPTITAVTPGGGPPAGGTLVTIAGAGFLAGETAASIGGASLVGLEVLSEAALRGRAPTSTAGAGTREVRVETPFGAAARPAGFSYQDAPIVVSLEPPEGPLGAARAVTIRGAGLAGAFRATLGGATLGALASPDADTLTGTTSSLLGAGAHDLLVETPNGVATLDGAYAVLDAPGVAAVTPSEGPLAGGTPVVVSGSGFLARAVTCTVGGAPLADLVVESDARISGRTPASGAAPGAGEFTVEGEVRVLTSGGEDALAPGFVYLAAPSVTAVAPPSGATAGGETIAISGTAFRRGAGATRVRIGGVAATVADVPDERTILAVTPPRGPGAAAVEVETSGGVGTRTAAYTYVEPDEGDPGGPAALAVTAVSPDAGPARGGTEVVVLGDGFVAGGTTVTIGGAALESVSVLSAKVLVGRTAPGAVGPQPVTVTTASPSASAALAAGFRYAPALSFTSTGRTLRVEATDAGVVEVRLSLGPTPLPAPVAADIVIGPNTTAETGGDFSVQGFARVVFAAGARDGDTGFVAVTAGDDLRRAEPDEVVELLLSDPSGGAILETPTRHVTTIVDDDPRVLTFSASIAGAPVARVPVKGAADLAWAVEGAPSARLALEPGDVTVTGLAGASRVPFLLPSATARLDPVAGFLLRAEPPGAKRVEDLEVRAARHNGSGSRTTSGYAPLGDGGTLFVGSHTANSTVGRDPGLFVSADDDVHVARYDASGSIQWVNTIRGPSGTTSGSHRIAALERGRFVVAGVLTGAGTAIFGPSDASPISRTLSGTCSYAAIGDVASGGFLDATVFGTATSTVVGIAPQSDGGFVVGGSYRSADTSFGAGEPTATTLPASAGLDDVYLARFDARARFVRAARHGGAADEDAVSLAAAPGGGFLLVVEHRGADARIGGVTLTSFSTTADEQAVAAFEPDGSVRWDFQESSDVPPIAAPLADGGAVVVGAFVTTVTFVADATTTLVQDQIGRRCFAARVDATGRLLWAKALYDGTALDPLALSPHADGGFALLAGLTSSVSAGTLDPGGAGAFPYDFTDQDRVVVSRWRPDGALSGAQMIRATNSTSISGPVRPAAPTPAGGFWFGDNVGSGSIASTTHIFGEGEEATASVSAFILGTNYFLARYEPRSWRPLALRPSGFAYAAVAVSQTALTGESRVLGADGYGDGGLVIGGEYRGRETFVSALGATPTAGIDAQSTNGVNAFIARFDVAGRVLWARQFGNTGSTVSERVKAVAALPDGGVVAAGQFRTAVTFGDPVSPSAFVLSPKNANSTEVFLTRYSAAGRFVWARCAGGPQTDDVSGLAVSPDGRVIVAGDIGGDEMTFGEASEPARTTLTASTYVATYDLDGGFRSVFGLGDFDNGDVFFGPTVAAATDGSMVLAAAYSGSVTLNAGLADEVVLAGDPNLGQAFVARYDRGGALAFVRTMRSELYIEPAAVALAPDDGVALAGVFGQSVTFAADPGPTFVAPPSAGLNSCGFVLRLDAAGDLVWARTASGTDDIRPMAVRVRGDGSVACSGTFEGAATFGLGEGARERTLTSEGDEDVFVALLGPSGDLVSAHGMGGPGEDGVILPSHRLGLALLPDGSVFVTGQLAPGTAVFARGAPNETSLAVVSGIGADAGHAFFARYFLDE